MHAYSTFELDVAATGTTDSGLTFGVTDSLTGGTSYTLSDSDGFDTNGGTLGNPSVFVSGAYGKMTFEADGLDAYNTDVSVDTGTTATLVRGHLRRLDGRLDHRSRSSAFVVSWLAPKLGGIALSADYNQDMAGYSIWDASAAYTMGAFTGTLSASNDNNRWRPAYDTAETLKLAYASGGVGAYVKAKTSYAGPNAEYAVGGSYASGPISLNVDVAT